MFGTASTGPYLPAYALTIAGTALRIYQWYHSRPLWLDEQMVLLNARDRTFSQLFGALWLNQAAPVGWLSLQRSVITAFGTGDRAMRAVPVLFAIATLWAACWMGRRWMKPLPAAVFVTLCGIAQWMTFYALEAKPYSADAFWALLLPALAIWAAEPADRQSLSLKRTAVWWTAAAAGQWFSYGATFVTPGCAVILFALAWRRSGTRAAAIFGMQGLVWLICFATHYQLSMAVASNDRFLRTYWAAGFPPADTGVAGALQWLRERAEHVASHPGGAASWILFWSIVSYGMAALVLNRPVAGLIVLSVPVSATLLALFHVAPLADRLAFWTVPAMYAAIAVSAGDVFTRFRAGVSRRTYAVLVVAALFSAGAILISREIIVLGRERIIVAGGNHGLDDGRALRLLMGHREPHDIFLTTHFGLPALWWYGNVSIATDAGGSRLLDGAPVFEIRHIWRGTEGCQNQRRLRALSSAIAGTSRAAVYLGFGSNDPPGFQDMVLDDLSKFGTRTFYSLVESEGVAAIYDFRQPPRVDETVPSEERHSAQLGGCVGVRSGRRW
jgi:hypothetical protein